MSWFDFSKIFGSSPAADIPEIFPVPIKEKDFVAIDMQAIYSRILTDTFERTDGIKEDQLALLWDNCLGSETPDGLVTLLAKAMRDQSDLFLVYFADLKVIRKADGNEQRLIREGYAKKAEAVRLDGGGTGIFVSFKGYSKSEMVKFYSALEFCGIGGVWKQGNVAKALQMKFKGFRGNISVADSDHPKTQATSLAAGLAAGKDIAIDGDDTVESAKPDLTASQSILDLVAQKRSFYLGLPASYIMGEQAKGLGDSGKSDTKAVERGLRAYYYSIVKPVAEGIFGIKTSFKSNDFEMLQTALEVLKTFDITSNDHLSMKNKTEIVNKSFGLPKGEEGDPPEKNSASLNQNPQDPNAPPTPAAAKPPPKVPAG